MKAVLDACVLYPTVMRELLLGAAKSEFFQPLWSPRILDEWARAALRDGPEIGASVRVEIALLKDRFPNASVTAEMEALNHQLPDPDDEHVLAAAIQAQADLLVTKNDKDFPRGILGHYGVARSDPDALLVSFMEEDDTRMGSVIDTVVAKAEHLSGQAQTPKKLLKKAGLSRLARRLG